MVVEISQALEMIEETVTPLTSEIVPIEECVGRILDEDITATQNLPAFDNSAMDGYAVHHSDAGKSFNCAATIFAGDRVDEPLFEGEIIKIMTGAPVPQGCTAIVPVEDVSVEGHSVTLPATIKEASHIRRKGEDIALGETLLHKGERIAAYHVALLASQGRSHVKVYRRPKVAVFATGEELKMHFEQVLPHQIYNSNAPTFLARAREWGAEVTFVGSAKDNLEDIKQHIEASLDADLIVTSGGVSVGDADFTREAFDSFGMERIFEKVNIKPGKPTTFGRIGSSWVLNLPGNPLAALINYELFGTKALLKLSGNSASHLQPISAQAGEDITLRPGRVTVIPGKWDGTAFIATPKRAPGMISPLIESNAMIIVDASVETIKKSESLRVLSLHTAQSSALAMPIINT